MRISIMAATPCLNARDPTIRPYPRGPAGTEALPSRLRQIGAKLLHGPGPALLHAVVRSLERGALFRRRVEGAPGDRERRLAASLGEGKHREHLDRP